MPRYGLRADVMLVEEKLKADRSNGGGGGGIRTLDTPLERYS
jgi:hypothetical protein